MWENLKNCISSGLLDEAIGIIDDVKKDEMEARRIDDVFCLLEASVWESVGNLDRMQDALFRGLEWNPSNFELYYMLGFSFVGTNVNKAFLCFQNALFLCTDESDKKTIQETIDTLKREYPVSVKKTAIIIVCYNSIYLQQKNIESIRETLVKDSYSIYVVDNASTDGVVEWMEEQRDVVLIRNEVNRGFAPACNQGAVAAVEHGDADADIFLLNNDTRLAQGSLFMLKLSLYENERVGAVGSVSNYAGNRQQIEVNFSLPNEYVEYGCKVNIPSRSYMEERVRLSGFAMLIRRAAYDKTGGFDEAFAPGYFEDDDLSMKLTLAGYKLYVCNNSFIYHAGSQSFAKRTDVNQLLIDHHALFMKKYGFDILDFAEPRMELLGQLRFGRDESFNVLVMDCGIGSDLKYLNEKYPHAIAIGIEKEEAPFNIVKESGNVFHSVEELKVALKQPVFDALIFDQKHFGRYGKEEIDTIASICKSTCQVIKRDNTYENVALEQVKMIIWDLDDTLWEGTLSEENIVMDPLRCQLIYELWDCGIVNSISSKNDRETVEKKLDELGLSGCFVFSDINWMAKGPQIAAKLKNMGLRAENVLFIDDNVRNLKEAEQYCPGLMTAEPRIIDRIVAYVNQIPKADPDHARLERYRILEKKMVQKRDAVSTEDFLYDSRIEIALGEDCIKNLDRIEELIKRTNQLNYTKLRSDKEDLKELLQDDRYSCRYVSVTDRFGDYGIAGFYCLEKETATLIHFLFSCRIMGMGIERYLYHKLEYPKITIVNPVSSPLDHCEEVKWVCETSKSEVRTKENDGGGIRLLLKGPCDMSSIDSYITGALVTTEFNYVNSKGFITTGQNHTMHLWQMAMCPEKIPNILREAPFLVYGDFESSIFEKEYDVICLSLLPDCHGGLYRNKETGDYLTFGGCNFDLTAPENTEGYITGEIVNHAFPFTKQIIGQFSLTWEFVGTTQIEDLIRNIEYIYHHVKGTPLLILCLGSEVEYEGDNAEFANHAKRHEAYNRAIERYAADKDRIRIINFTDYISGQADYEDCINHFSRDVYYRIAKKIMDYMTEHRP